MNETENEGVREEVTRIVKERLFRPPGKRPLQKPDVRHSADSHLAPHRAGVVPSCVFTRRPSAAQSRILRERDFYHSILLKLLYFIISYW